MTSSRGQRGKSPSLPKRNRHLQILLNGVEAWNEWRDKNPFVRPYLITRGDLDEVLSGMDLRGVNFSDTFLGSAHLRGSDLRGANLQNAHLVYGDLAAADFGGADLSMANLHGAMMPGARFRASRLNQANLTNAGLWEADFRKAELIRTDFTDAGLVDANFSQATLMDTIFGANDLSSVIGLERINHRGPSVIGIETVYFSKGNIPEVFLRGAGVPDNFIAYMSSLTGSALEFYSCFISYSNRDQKFAVRLHADLQAKGIRCWLAINDLRIGDKIRATLDEAIRRHEKLLVILTKDSIKSDWVEQEIETALARERREKKLVLFPIRLDDAVMDAESGWPALLNNTRHIGDFTKWKSYSAYEKAFARLIRDLRTADMEVE